MENKLQWGTTESLEMELLDQVTLRINELKEEMRRFENCQASFYEEINNLLTAFEKLKNG